MRMNRLKILISLLILISYAPVYSQGESAVDTVSSQAGIEIQTSVDRAEIYIGDLITYKIIILYDSTFELIPPPLGANLGNFDVKDYDSDIITKLDDGRIQSENIFKLSTFTTGDYVIPPIPIVFNLPDGTKKALFSESIPIKVNSLLGNVDDSTDIKPLKAQYEFVRDYTLYYIWGGVGLLVLLLAAFLIWRRLRRTKEKIEPIDLRPPWEIAFEKLAMLKQKNLPAEGMYKSYYFELTEIIRAYNGKMYDMNVLDMTTEEFLDLFKLKELPDDIFDRTKKLLNHADLVKFAKFVPEQSRIDIDYEEVHQMIEIARSDYEMKKRMETSLPKPAVSVPEKSNVDEVKS